MTAYRTCGKKALTIALSLGCLWLTDEKSQILGFFFFGISLWMVMHMRGYPLVQWFAILAFTDVLGPQLSAILATLQLEHVHSQAQPDKLIFPTCFTFWQKEGSLGASLSRVGHSGQLSMN